MSMIDINIYYSLFSLFFFFSLFPYNSLMSDIKDVLRSLRPITDAMSDELVRYKADAESKVARISTLEKETKNQKRKIVELGKEIQTLQDKISTHSTLYKENEDLVQENKRLKQKNEDLKEQLVDAEEAALELRDMKAEYGITSCFDLS